MQRRLPGLVLIACSLMAAPVANAFTFRFLRDTVLRRLTPEDIEIGTRATREALDSGEDAEWSNPATGASGSIRILATIDVDDMTGCRRTQMTVTIAGQTGTGTYLLCQATNGAWLFYTPRQTTR